MTDFRPTLEHEWKSWLSTWGFPVPRSVFVPVESHGPGSLAAARDLRPPLVVKALGSAIVHKTEAGAVRLAIPGGDALATAVAAMLEELRGKGLGPIAGILVEEMAEPGLELLLGVLADREFGRLLAFGLGGTRVEALGEVRFFALPLRPFDLDTVLASVPWLAPALARFGPATAAEVRDAVWRFGGPDGPALHPSLDRLEINPLIASARGVVGVDARGAFR